MSSVAPTHKNLDTIKASERTVVDVVYGLNAIAGADVRDPLCLSPLRPREKDYNQSLASEYAMLRASFGLLWKR
jgi:Asp-tRNA(Asn)/Glu-tRNA(Gln) amidotransferase A subunit family amidase